MLIHTHYLDLLLKVQANLSFEKIDTNSSKTVVGLNQKESR
jgi:hypothetical protein